MRKFLVLIFIVLALPAAAQQKNGAAVRLIYFSDDYSINSNLQNALQNSLLNQPDYIIERVEKRPTFFNGNSYIIPQEADISDADLNKPGVIYRTMGKQTVITTPSSLMLQEPQLDKSITSYILNNESDSAKNFVVAQTVSARAGSITMPAGNFGIVSTDVAPLTAAWAPAVMINYYLSTPEGQSLISVFEKPMGGIGAWYDPVKNIQKTSSLNPIIINMGGISQYLSVMPQPSFFADYWKQMQTDILAIAPKDIDIIWSLVKTDASAVPALLASNIEPVGEDTPNPFIKTKVIERNGVKIGFFALMDASALNLAAGRQIPYKTTEITTAAKDAVTKLKKEDGADFIVLVSHLKDGPLNFLLSKQYGIDMVLTGASVDSASLRNRSIILKDWNKERHFVPAYISRGNGHILGDTKIVFEQNSAGLSPSLVEDYPPLDVYKDNSFDNKFYAVNRTLLSGLSKEGSAILPRARVLSQAAGCAPSFAYSPLDIYNMTAVILKNKLKAEAVLLKVQDFKEQIFGGVTEQELRNWLKENDSPLVKGKIKGSDLKNILAKADFSTTCSAQQKDYQENFTLAVSGVVKDDDKYKINTLTISDDEFYTIAFPSGLFNERIALPSLKSQVFAVKETDENLSDALITHLKNIYGQTELKAREELESYQQGYLQRKEEGTSPSTETEMLLDPKVDDLGPAAAQEYFERQAEETYTENLLTLINKDTPMQGIWRLNLRNMSLQFTNTNIKNSQEYKNFSNTRLNSDSQTLIQGKFNLAAEYYRNNIRWDNSLLMEYGKVTLRPATGDKVVNESVDKISLATEYTYKSITVDKFLGGFLMGPFLSLGYETEFTKQDNNPRYKVLRGKGGVRLFEGEYLKDLYLALVPELDYTYEERSTKWAWEFGFKIEQPVNDNTKAVYTAMVRDFFIVETNKQTSLSYEFELDARLKMEVWKRFSVSPFVNYYQAKAKTFDKTGSNLFVGVSLSYSRLFKYMPFWE